MVFLQIVLSVNWKRLTPSKKLKLVSKTIAPIKKDAIEK